MQSSTDRENIEQDNRPSIFSLLEEYNYTPVVQTAEESAHYWQQLEEMADRQEPDTHPRAYVMMLALFLRVYDFEAARDPRIVSQWSGILDHILQTKFS